jgi:hypothetical protein
VSMHFSPRVMPTMLSSHPRKSQRINISEDSRGLVHKPLISFPTPISISKIFRLSNLCDHPRKLGQSCKADLDAAPVRHFTPWLCYAPPRPRLGSFPRLCWPSAGQDLIQPPSESTAKADFQLASNWKPGTLSGDVPHWPSDVDDINEFRAS